MTDVANRSTSLHNPAMEAFFLIFKLLEKIAVLVAAVLLLVMIRPAGVWLTETGHQASIRRRTYLAILLGSLAIWGSFLGLSFSGFRFNVRMVGIMAGGFLGGRSVGLIVGILAGLVYGLSLGGSLGWFAFSASVLVGLFAGFWSKRFGTNVASIAIGSVVIQILYHALLGGIMAAVDSSMVGEQLQNLPLHLAKIAANTIGVVLFMGVLNLVSELERAHESVRKSKDEVRSARLEALQYQVRPHFLFNILNTLSYLIRTDPSKARELTLDLSEFLRYTLSREEDVTTLRDELEQIEKYVSLERARFGDGLVFEISDDIPDEAMDLPVPPLVLQPLVENAIRHGSNDGKISISVAAEESEESVHIFVRDNGRGLTTPPREGVGLSNVRQRLDRFYGGRGELEVKEGEKFGVEVTIKIRQKRSVRRRILDEARRRLEEAVA